MSSIVSRRPSSRNQENEAFWMSIRLGRSRTCFRREKLVRARGAATLLVKCGSLPLRLAAVCTDGRTGGTSAQPARVPDRPHPTQGHAAPDPGYRRALYLATREKERGAGRAPP